MNSKMTSEELEQKVKRLEEENFNLKKTEEALRKSEEEYRNLFDSIPDPVSIVQENFNVLLNNEFTRLLGYDHQDIQNGLSPTSIVEGDENKEIARKRVEERLAGEDVFPASYTANLFCKDGSTMPFEIKGTLIQYNGRPADLVVFRDVTERLKTEKIIHSLTHRLIKSQENERKLISRELHDQVAQDLSSARIICEMLLNNELESISEGEQKIFELSEILHSTIKAVRALAYDLRPPGLEELGLVQTLYHYCRDFSEQNGIMVEFKSAGMKVLNLNFDTEINLYRIIQEGLNNIRRHSDAKKADIRLISSFPDIILRIEDYGRGFDVQGRVDAAFEEKRMGLQSMKERVTLLQGKMKIQSLPMKGTKILIEVPYNEDLYSGELAECNMKNEFFKKRSAVF